MKKDNLVYAQDIYNAILKIEEYLGDSDKIALANNDMLKDAIIRQFEIIGEASARLSFDFAQKYPNVPFQSAKDLRNLLIHEYDCVNIDNVWLYIQEDLPPFKQQLKSLLSIKD